jgi:hypothetical protein
MSIDMNALPSPLEQSLEVKSEASVTPDDIGAANDIGLGQKSSHSNKDS